MRGACRCSRRLWRRSSALPAHPALTDGSRDAGSRASPMPAEKRAVAVCLGLERRRRNRSLGCPDQSTARQWWRDAEIDCVTPGSTRAPDVGRARVGHSCRTRRPLSSCSTAIRSILGRASWTWRGYHACRSSLHIGLQRDETGEKCEWQLPLAHALESWSDARAVDGTATILQPVISPFYDVRTAHQIFAMLLGETDPSSDAAVRETWRQNFGDAFERAGSKRCMTASSRAQHHS